MGVKNKITKKTVNNISKTLGVDKIVNKTLDTVVNGIEKSWNDKAEIKKEEMKEEAKEEKEEQTKIKNNIEKIKNYKFNDVESINKFFTEAKTNIKAPNIDDDEYKMWFIKSEEAYERAQEITTDKEILNKISKKYDDLKKHKKNKNFLWLVFIFIYILLVISLFSIGNNFALVGFGIGILICSIITFIYFNINFSNIEESIKKFKFKNSTENLLCVFASIISIIIIILGLIFGFVNKFNEENGPKNYYDNNIEKYDVSIDIIFKDNLIFNRCDVTMKIYDIEEHFNHGEDRTVTIKLPKGIHKLEFVDVDDADTETEKIRINGETKVSYKLECTSDGLSVSEVSSDN